MSVRQKSGELMIITALYLSEPTFFFFLASLKNGEKSTCSKILPVLGTVRISAVSWDSRSHVYHGVLINTILPIFSLLVLKPRNVGQYVCYCEGVCFVLGLPAGQVDSICPEQGVVLLESSRNPRNPETSL